MTITTSQTTPGNPLPSSRARVGLPAALGLVSGLACHLACAAPSLADAGSFDFSAVTALAEGAVLGQNVSTPVPGFDLLLMKDGVVVYHKSFGSWSLNRLANADSATKTLSGAVIMSLVDSAPRPFTLDTKLSQYIPAFASDKANITIRHAFSHTSGMGNSTAAGSQTLTLQQAAVQIAATPLSFSPPGSRFSYGGTSMHAAGAVAELAGQSSWNSLFEQRIRSRVGMPDSSYVLSTPTNPRIAGGCESTASDFARFMEMLRRGGTALSGTPVLSSAAVAQMFTRQTAKPIPILNTPLQSPYTDGADYGIGVWLDERGPRGELLGALAAGARGFSSWIDFDDGMVGVFATDLTNSGNIQPLLYLIRAQAQLAARNPLCPGDLNYDGRVDDTDFVSFAAAYQLSLCNDPDQPPPIPSSCPADLTGDGLVNDADFVIFAQAYEVFACDAP